MREMKVVIAVVLDDRETELISKRQQPQAPLWWQQDCGRELMMWRQIYASIPSAPADLFEFSESHALVVYMRGFDVDAVSEKRFTGGRIAQCLQHSRVTGLSQHARGNENRHLAAARQTDSLSG